MWYRGRRTAKGEDFARGERLLGRLGEIKDGRVEETWIEKGFFVAGGVRPREVPAGKMSESWLVVTSQLAGPIVEGCTYIRRVLGEGGEDQPIAGGMVPGILSISIGFDLERQKEVKLYMAARL